MNLLEETLEVLSLNEKSIDDVLYVSDGDSYTSWNHFAEVASSVEYDEGYGSREINGALIVVGDNWWLERAEYDGSEWWVLQSPPVKPTVPTHMNLKVREED